MRPKVRYRIDTGRFSIEDEEILKFAFNKNLDMEEGIFKVLNIFFPNGEFDYSIILN